MEKLVTANLLIFPHFNRLQQQRLYLNIKPIVDLYHTLLLALVFIISVIFPFDFCIFERLRNKHDDSTIH